MSEQLNLNNLRARRFTATIINGRFVFQQAPSNYQVVAQNIRAADVLGQHDNVNSEHLEPQERGLPHVVDLSTARRRLNAQRRQALRRPVESDEIRALRLQNMAAHNAETRAAENDEATAVRRHNDALRVAATRAAENDEARAVRLQNMAANNAATRAAENDEAAAVRRRNDIGPMTSVCEHCHALKFEDENSFKCCHGGKVSLPNLEPYPQELSDLMFEDTAQGKNFRANIRQFNSAFSFASFGANIANIAPPPGRGPPCFRLCGQVVHRSGTLHPEHGPFILLHEPNERRSTVHI